MSRYRLDRPSGQCCGGHVPDPSAAVPDASERWPSSRPIEARRRGWRCRRRAAVRCRSCRSRAGCALGASAAAAALDRRPRPRVPGRGAAGRRGDRHRPAAGRDRAGGAGAPRLRADPQPRLDFTLCSAVLERGDFAYLGLIGSATKRAKFERGFRELGIRRSGSPPWSARSAAPSCATSGRR